MINGKTTLAAAIVAALASSGSFAYTWKVNDKIAKTDKDVSGNKIKIEKLEERNVKIDAIHEWVLKQQGKEEERRGR